MKGFAIFCLCIVGVWALPKKIGPRVIGGDEASPGQFPWQATVHVTSGTSRIICGGVILSNEWILTAGHCLPTVAAAQVETGVVDLDTQKPVVSRIDSVHVHNDFDNILLLNDVALVKLAGRLAFDEYTQAIPIASEVIGAGVEVTVSGWGAVEDGDPNLSNQLHYTNLLTLGNDHCSGIFGSDIIDDGRLCAQSEGDVVSGPCTGDSGDPLVVDAFGDPKLVGIVSFISDAGCSSDYPSGYSRITFHLKWITNITGITAS